MRSICGGADPLASTIYVVICYRTGSQSVDPVSAQLVASLTHAKPQNPGPQSKRNPLRQQTIKQQCCCPVRSSQ